MFKTNQTTKETANITITIFRSYTLIYVWYNKIIVNLKYQVMFLNSLVITGHSWGRTRSAISKLPSVWIGFWFQKVENCSSYRGLSTFESHGLALKNLKERTIAFNRNHIPWEYSTKQQLKWIKYITPKENGVIRWWRALLNVVLWLTSLAWLNNYDRVVSSKLTEGPIFWLWVTFKTTLRKSFWVLQHLSCKARTITIK